MDNNIIDKPMVREIIGALITIAKFGGAFVIYATDDEILMDMAIEKDEWKNVYEKVLNNADFGSRKEVEKAVKQIEKMMGKMIDMK